MMNKWNSLTPRHDLKKVWNKLIVKTLFFIDWTILNRYFLFLFFCSFFHVSERSKLFFHRFLFWTSPLFNKKVDSLSKFRLLTETSLSPWLCPRRYALDTCLMFKITISQLSGVPFYFVGKLQLLLLFIKFVKTRQC